MLKDWFTSLAAHHPDRSDNLRGLMEGCQRESMTGLVRLEDFSGELFLFTFINGKGLNLFEYRNGKWMRVPQPQWETKCSGFRFQVWKAHLPVQGVRACEVILAADVEQKESLRLPGTQLLHHLQSWCELSEPGFIHLIAEGQEIFGLIFGDSASNMEVLTFKGNEAIFSVEQPDDLRVSADHEYDVRLYLGDTGQEIWLETRLRLAFAVLVRMMIQRFGTMVGFILADRLCARLTEAVQAQRLNIKISSNGLENSHMFRSLQEASQAYSFILNSFFEEASVLIGPRLSKEIAMSTLEKLSTAQKVLLVSNLYELSGPQFNFRSTRGEQVVRSERAVQ